MASLRKATSIGTLWALCSSSASSPSSPKPKPPPPQGNHPHVPQKTGRPDHVGPSFNLFALLGTITADTYPGTSRQNFLLRSHPASKLASPEHPPLGRLFFHRACDSES